MRRGDRGQQFHAVLATALDHRGTPIDEALGQPLVQCIGQFVLDLTGPFFDPFFQRLLDALAMRDIDDRTQDDGFTT